MSYSMPTTCCVMPDGLRCYLDIFVSNALKEDQRSYAKRGPLLCLLMGAKVSGQPGWSWKHKRGRGPGASHVREKKGANP
ncbi:hypothetical protein FHW68_000367 [Pseudomonas sp. Tn43]|nr:hypothetical protein [Pseudomonas sp. Tn43]